MNETTETASNWALILNEIRLNQQKSTLKRNIMQILNCVDIFDSTEEFEAWVEKIYFSLCSNGKRSVLS